MSRGKSVALQYVILAASRGQSQPITESQPINKHISTTSQSTKSAVIWLPLHQTCSNSLRAKNAGEAAQIPPSSQASFRCPTSSSSHLVAPSRLISCNNHVVTILINIQLGLDALYHPHNLTNPLFTATQCAGGRGVWLQCSRPGLDPRLRKPRRVMRQPAGHRRARRGTP